MLERRTMRTVQLAVVLAAVAGPGLADSQEDMALTREGPDLLSFESRVPPAVRVEGEADLSLSDERFLLGTRSLRWDWTDGSAIRFDLPVVLREGSVGRHAQAAGEMPAVTMFVFWLYNETPLDRSLEVEFGRGDTVDCRFPFRLDFTGWRTAWVRFADMEGTPAPEMDFFRFKAPAGAERGRFFVDGIVPATLVDEREPDSDYQVQVRERVPVIDWSGPGSGGAYPPASAEERAALDHLDRTIAAASVPQRKVTEKTMAALRERMATFGIERRGDQVTGRHVLQRVQGAAFPPDYKDVYQAYARLDFRATGKLLRDLAFAYHATDHPASRAELERLYLDLSRHLLDQGWSEGSILGTNHHFGYNAREYYLANYLMRDVLDRDGLLTRVSRAMQWYNSARGGKSTRMVDLELGMNMDYLNTFAKGTLYSLLSSPDPDERAFWVRQFSGNLGRMIATMTNNHDGGFKTDGTAFHHWGHYPAYAIGAFNSGAELFRWLAPTPFRLSPEAYTSFNRALHAATVYTIGEDGPNGTAGRHPFRTRLELAPAVLNMAMAGRPDGEAEVDPAMAATYLRLAPADEAGAGRTFRAEGISPEAEPVGHWTFPYASLSIHRRPGWMVSVKGYSKFVWATEVYSPINRFGRYQSNGTVELLGRDGMAASGYRVDGWDWNRYPGTTTVHLPLDRLVPPIDVTMHYSQETFVGGTSLSGRDGLFAMVLNEQDFGHTLYARKSVFCFDGRIVCLGSGIRCTNREYPTETTLFQAALPAPDTPTWVNDPAIPITALPYEAARGTNGNVVLGDPYGHAYYVPGGQALRVFRQEQQSEHSHEVRPTQGAFATALIDHGAAPDGARYEYAILVDTEPSAAMAFARGMQGDAPAYQVLARGDAAHVVRDQTTRTTGYALFEAGRVDQGALASASAPCLVMLGEDDRGLRLSVADPDLRMQATRYPAVLPAEYRLDQPSLHPEGVVTLVLRGRHVLAREHPQCRVVEQTPTQTTLEVTCRYGQPVEVDLVPAAPPASAPGP